MAFLDLVSHLASDRAYLSPEFEDPVAFWAGRDEEVHEDGEEVREGHATAWASSREEIRVHRADGGFWSGWKGVEDVGVFGGVGCDQHRRYTGSVNGRIRAGIQVSFPGFLGVGIRC